MGFMLGEIALLQYFSVYLGHPIYSLGVCLFSLILASGLGSLTSDWLKLNTRGKLLLWGCMIVLYLAVMERVLPSIFQSTTDRERLVRIGISLVAIMPLGFLLGFAFPTGIRLVSAIDTQPTPWFWGINGATGVLASVLGVMFSMSFGINVTMLIAATCYLLLIPASSPCWPCALSPLSHSGSSIAVCRITDRNCARTMRDRNLPRAYPVQSHAVLGRPVRGSRNRASSEVHPRRCCSTPRRK